MFVSCALAEAIPGPNPSELRVLAYEHHPNRVGEAWPMAETCWERDAQQSCVRALQYTTAACTPVLGEQLGLDFTCRLEGERCVQVDNPVEDSARTPTEPIASPDVIDFEDQLSEDDAGSADPSTLPSKPKYARYRNGRFGFSLDVPTAFVADEPPFNGDGQRWRIPGLVAVVSSGFPAIPELGPSCPNSKHVLARSETSTSCWATGKRDGFIFWERSVIAAGVDYSLRFQYVESLKEQMDPIVTHVNKSWTF
jgi:hypothetical protein